MPDHASHAKGLRGASQKTGGAAEVRNPRQVAVAGATGYAGFALAKLLLRHPAIEKPVFYLRDTSARCLTEMFPQLRGWGEAAVRPLSAEAIAASRASAAFLSLPHEASMELAPQLLEAGLRVVDLSGAFRFREPETFSDWYNLPAPPAALLQQAVYGFPELYPAPLPQAHPVPNPPANPTSP